MMKLNHVYLGIGGNIGNVEETITSTLESIQNLPGVLEMQFSPFYRTKPVPVNLSPEESIPQDDFLNTVCRITTTLEVRSLFSLLEYIEIIHGKVPKEKDEPRRVDIDIIFYGNQPYKDEKLEIPHARWKERLFVLIPLLNITKTMMIEDQDGPGQSKVYNIAKMVKSFTEEKLAEISLHPRNIPTLIKTESPYAQCPSQRIYAWKGASPLYYFGSLCDRKRVAYIEGGGMPKKILYILGDKFNF